MIIKKQTMDSIGTGLTVDSVIRLHKMVTISKNLIKRKLGTINKTLELELNTKIKKLFESN